MPDLRDISVPCPCGAELLLGHAACPSCRAAIPPELKEALEQRLEGSYAEYREAKREVARASILLLVFGLLHLVVGLPGSLLAAGSVQASGGDVLLGQLSLVADGAIGVAFLACWHAARRAPVAATTAALAIWTVVRLALFLVAPAELLLSFLSAGGIAILIGKVAVFVLLARAVLAARRLRALQEGIARGGALAQVEGPRPPAKPPPAGSTSASS
jgi:hypothetical protein